MLSALGKQWLMYATVRLDCKLRKGNFTIEDKNWSIIPVSASTTVNIDLAKTDIWGIDMKLSITDRVHHIVHIDLNIKKISINWMTKSMQHARVAKYINLSDFIFA